MGNKSGDKKPKKLRNQHEEVRQNHHVATEEKVVAYLRTLKQDQDDRTLDALAQEVYDRAQPQFTSDGMSLYGAWMADWVKRLRKMNEDTGDHNVKARVAQKAHLLDQVCSGYDAYEKQRKEVEAALEVAKLCEDVSPDLHQHYLAALVPAKKGEWELSMQQLAQVQLEIDQVLLAAAPSASKDLLALEKTIDAYKRTDPFILAVHRVLAGMEEARKGTLKPIEVVALAKEARVMLGQMDELYRGIEAATRSLAWFQKNTDQKVVGELAQELEEVRKTCRRQDFAKGVEQLRALQKTLQVGQGEGVAKGLASARKALLAHSKGPWKGPVGDALEELTRAEQERWGLSKLLALLARVEPMVDLLGRLDEQLKGTEVFVDWVAKNVTEAVAARFVRLISIAKAQGGKGDLRGALQLLLDMKDDLEALRKEILTPEQRDRFKHEDMRKSANLLVKELRSILNHPYKLDPDEDKAYHVLRETLEEQVNRLWNLDMCVKHVVVHLDDVHPKLQALHQQVLKAYLDTSVKHERELERIKVLLESFPPTAPSFVGKDMAKTYAEALELARSTHKAAADEKLFSQLVPKNKVAGAALDALQKLWTGLLKSAPKDSEAEARLAGKVQGARAKLKGTVDKLESARKKGCPTRDIQGMMNDVESLVKKDLGDLDEKFVIGRLSDSKTRKATLKNLSALHRLCEKVIGVSPPRAALECEKQFNKLMKACQRNLVPEEDLRRLEAAYLKDWSQDDYDVCLQVHLPAFAEYLDKHLEVTKLKAISVLEAAGKGPSKRQDAQLAVKGLDEEVLARLPAKVLQDTLALLQLDRPTIADKKAMAKIYKVTKLDEAFLKDDEGKRQDMTKNLVEKHGEELAKAKKGWAGLSVDEKLKALGKVVAQQCKSFGMQGPPPLVPIDMGAMLLGLFVPSLKVIQVNVNPNSPQMTDFKVALDTVIHENGHNYQDQLVTGLIEVKPDDPRAAQLAWLVTNTMGGSGYLPPDLDHAAYRAQPLEAHAYDIGPKTAKALLTELAKLG